VLLDLIKKDLRDGGDGSGPVGEKAPQPLRHRNHPLPHRYRRDDVIGEMGGGLCHVPTVAGGADAAALDFRDLVWALVNGEEFLFVK
jgi:hypothetical protein